MSDDISIYFWQFVDDINSGCVDDDYFHDNQIYQIFCQLKRKIHLSYSVFFLFDPAQQQYPFRNHMDKSCTFEQVSTGFIFEDIHALFEESVQIFEFVGNHISANKVKKCIQNMQATLVLLDDSLFNSLDV